MIFEKVFQRKTEYFLAVNIFPKSCNLATFVMEAGDVNITNSTFYHFGQGETLTDVVRQFLQKAGATNHVKVIFGLPSFWIEGEQVKPEFERVLLAVTEELKLVPMAFVSTSAAIGFYKFRQNPALASFYILEFFDKKVVAEKFDKGEVVKSQVESFEQIASLDFSTLFRTDKPRQIFVYTKDDFTNIKTQIEQFLKDTAEATAEISGINAEDFAKSLATATAFDLGKLESQTQPAPREETKIKEEFGFIQEADVGEIEPASVTGPEKPGKRKSLLNLLKFLPAVNLVRLLGRRKMALAAVSGIGAIFALLAVFWFLPQATVELFVRSSVFTKDFEVKAVPTAAAVNSQTQTIPAKVLTTVKEGSKKAVTTGKKKIGDKAQGSVTVFNKTAAVKTFSAGTVIVSPSNLRFVLTESPVVASRSAVLEGITFGKGRVKVEATEIGEAGNLPQDTNFTFADFDSSLYSAHSDEAFVGGTSKEVNVVAIEDRKKLEAELIRELAAAAKTELIQGAADLKIEEAAIVAKPAQLQFDKDIGAEANLLTLQAKVGFTTTAFAASNVEQVITEELKGQLPQGFSNWQNTKIETKILKVADDGTLTIAASFGADLIPEISQGEIITQILGKSPDSAKNYLLSITDVENVTIRISPRLPGFLGNLPRAKSRIKIEVKAQRI